MVNRLGQAATIELTRLELGQTPEKYVRVQVSTDAQGRVLLLVGNQSPLDIADVEVMAAYFDNLGRQVSATQRFRVARVIPAGQSVAVPTAWTDPQGLRTGVVSARPAD